MMHYIETDSTDPAMNLAYEEYFLHRTDLPDDLFMLYQNEPAVIIGRFQNIWGEVNLAFAQSHHIPVFRRISGGGTVYHDLGNLCYSFIANGISIGDLDPSQFSCRVQSALGQLGIHAEVGQRNDLLINDKKIGGTAMALQKGKLLFHGTLLFDSNLEMLHQVLSVPFRILESRATPSRKSAVTTIKSCQVTTSLPEFKLGLKKVMFPGQAVNDYLPTPGDEARIRDLAATKYRNWQWNYAINPPTKIEMVYPIPGGELDIRLDLHQGRIETAQIVDTRFPQFGFDGIIQHLKHVRYWPEDIQRACEAAIGVEEEGCPIKKKALALFLIGINPDLGAFDIL